MYLIIDGKKSGIAYLLTLVKYNFDISAVYV